MFCLEILNLLMPGVQHHINSSESKVHRLGMIVGEVVTATVDPDGPKLSFEVSGAMFHHI